MMLGDLLMGGPQTYSVPEPQVSIADLLTGQTMSPAAPPVSGNPVATAYADSPAPGAVAAAGAQANAAASQEPGIFDQARNWAKTNPVQAQALMQGFAALASGRTHGNAIMQLGQAAGTGMQTMAEQNAANDAQQRERLMQDQRQALQNRQETRLDRTADANIRFNDDQGSRAERRLNDDLKTAASNRKAKDQSTDQAAKMFTPRMEEAKLSLDKIRADIAATSDLKRKRALEIEAAEYELKIRKQFGTSEAEAILGKRLAEQARAEEQATQSVLETDQAVWQRDNRNMLSPEDRQRLARGEKLAPSKVMTPAEYARQLIKDNPEAYRDSNDRVDTARAMRDAKELLAIENYDPDADQKGFDAAMAAAKPGARFTYKDVTYIKPK